MRRGNGGDRERSGDPHFSQRDERRQSSALRQLVVHTQHGRSSEGLGR